MLTYFWLEIFCKLQFSIVPENSSDFRFFHSFEQSDTTIWSGEQKARKCNTKSCSLVYFDVLRFMEQVRKEAKKKRKKAQNTKTVYSQLWC